MRCCIVGLNLNSGGAERHMLQMLQNWPGSSWEFDVILLANQGVWFDEIPKNVGLYTLSDQMPSDGVKQLVWAAQLAPKLRSYLSNGYDLVLTFLWLPTLVTSIALRGLSTAPLFVWSVQSDLEQAFRLRKTGVIRQWLVRNIAVPQIDQFITISPGMSTRTQQLLKVSEERFHIIPNSIDFNRISGLLAKKTSITSKNKAIRLVTVGRLHPQKGIDILLQAISNIRKRDLDLECIIVGEGGEKTYLQGLANDFQISDFVQFIGYSDNPYSWMRSADIFVLASRWEPFGIVLAEAMALGLPIISTDTDGGNALIAPGVDGIIVPTNDSSALSDAIYELVHFPQRRESLGENAKHKVKTLDASTIATLHESLFCELVNKRLL